MNNYSSKSTFYGDVELKGTNTINGYQKTVSADKGIVKNNDTLSLTDEFYSYLDDKTYEQTLPSVSSLSCNGDMSLAEIGQSTTISTITHSETYIAKIKTLKFNGEDITPSATSTTVTLTSPITVTSTSTSSPTTTKTYYLSGTNTRDGTFSRSISKTFYVPTFTGTNVNESVSAEDITSMTKARYLQKTVTIADVNKYIYFVTISTITKVSSSGFEVPMQSPVTTSVTINGVNVNYNVYRTSNPIQPGTYTFEILPSDI